MTTNRQNTLERILVRCGLGNRRYCAWLVRQGHVRIKGRIARDAKKNYAIGGEIIVNGKRHHPAPLQTWKLNKPPGIRCQSGEGEKSAIDFFPQNLGLGLIGRLDKESEGLILASNDGDLAYHLTHPEHAIEKFYRVSVSGRVSEQDFKKLCSGLPLDGKKTKALRGEILERGRKETLLLLILKEGKKRQIRRLCAKLGYPVNKLQREGIGKLNLDRLPSGQVEKLTKEELDSLLVF
jgi:pseudouridine synthase